MKYILTGALIYAIVLPSIATNNSPTPEQRGKAEAWLNIQSVQFLENKGQLADMNGKPVPFVLFKAEAQGIDMYVTEKGLTYVFMKIKEEHEDLKKEDDRWTQEGQKKV